ncbi:N-succinylarginine dihydrolase [Myxococcaceae bacterium GXIMD 01537]
MREYNFDGLVGPTHNYGGLSPGNLASTSHGGQSSYPREAALQGLEKMRFVSGLGVGQAVLPPHPRPSLKTLRALGFGGTDEEVITRAARDAEHLLRLTSSAAAMWTANAATVAPSSDTADGRLHLTPANLQQMFHRVIEAEVTHSVLGAIFSDAKHFAVHAPLPGGGHFADEGAANHTRLSTEGRPAVHLFAWGRAVWKDAPAPQRFPARQTFEASQALARLHQVAPEQCLFPQQHPEGIDAGAFHTDVVAVGNGGFLMLHELAFLDAEGLLAALREKLGPGFTYVVAGKDELPAKDAVKAYPFNSQVLTLPDGTMAIIAPVESRETPAARRFLERVVAEENPVKAVHYLDVRQSMNNGGGPACLRQRIPLTDAERAAVKANVFYTPALHEALAAWVKKHYREELKVKDLGDPQLARETMTALDELTRILAIGSVYDFQR